MAKAIEGWEFDAVSLGFPGLVIDGRIARDPLNLSGGWMNFDFEKAFARPVRIINDASMQALASYVGGRMLFLGFGTSTGATLIVDDVIIPLEIGVLRLTRGRRFMDCLSNEALQRDGRKAWVTWVYEAIEIMRDVAKPDEIVLGGGNAKFIDPIPKGCRQRDNQHAFQGATRLWPGADMLAEPYGSSWRIRRRRRSTPRG